MNPNIPQFSIVTRKDGTGYTSSKEFGNSYLMFMGLSPHNPTIAIVAQCRQDVVGYYNGYSIMAQPQSILIYETLDNLVIASDDILKELGII